MNKRESDAVRKLLDLSPILGAWLDDTRYPRVDRDEWHEAVEELSLVLVESDMAPRSRKAKS